MPPHAVPVLRRHFDLDSLDRRMPKPTSPPRFTRPRGAVPSPGHRGQVRGGVDVPHEHHRVHS
eukprot:CAMPEP_0113675764 /NCGR_PEP_ID=MMETSP0038_2-20120614/8218_1 /TAXON_ID=2898 /ORGANISM="Cryptomonas paramecium" /LENGTH=62 /DNA_ID=CAMNT_0000592617 /DNA_START=104 /DNA_END=289 /DNA_ORIENTATION=- /assembly_acc=CAM_ASM_000170